MRASLHTHTIYSDGSETPEEIVRLADIAKIDLLSLTDHNTFDGYPRFEQSCKELGIKYVKGIEIDCLQTEIGFNREVLAYFPNGGDEKMTDVIARKQSSRHDRVENAINIARKVYDIPSLDIKEFEAFAIEKNGFTGMLSNRLLYSYIRSKSKNSSEMISYSDVKGMSYWKDMWRREGFDNSDTLWELIQLIFSAGGFAVLPHYGFHLNTDTKMMMKNSKRYIDELSYMKSIGLWGIELHPYYYHPQKDQINSIIRSWAEQIGLNLTTGSDFHGTSVPQHKIYEEYEIEFKGFPKVNL